VLTHETDVVDIIQLMALLNLVFLHINNTVCIMQKDGNER